MTQWSDFFVSPSIPYSSDAKKYEGIPNKFFLKFSNFQNIKSAIRCVSDNSIESLISDSIFSDCYSDEEGGVILYRLRNGKSVIHRVCGYNCYSNQNRSFGYVISYIENYLNFSSFNLCPSKQHEDRNFGSITLVLGFQIGNNINSSHNYGYSEGCIIFNHQQKGSRISFVVCADSHSKAVRSFFVGYNVLVFSCSIIRCSSDEDLIHFSGSGEIVGCNIVDCESVFSIGCAINVSKAFDIFINNDLPYNKGQIILVRQLSSNVLHPHYFLRTYQCWDGVLFKKSICCKRYFLLKIISPLIESLAIK